MVAAKTFIRVVVLLAFASLLCVGPALAEEPAITTQAALGAAFTYQGRLTDGGAPANGVYDFAFSLWDAESGGAQVGATVEVGDVSVTNGVFTVSLDFGTAIFNGQALWLQVSVRPGASSDPYTTLSPRTKLNAAPYAIGLMPGASISRDFLGHALTVQNGSPGGMWILDRKAIAAWTSDGTALFGAAGTGVAVYGIHASTSGTSAAIRGITNSTEANAVAVLGEVSSTAPGNMSAAVRGINNGTAGSGIGVWGSHAGSGWGVYGTSASGFGVYGLSSTGHGVYALSGGSARNHASLRASNSNASGGMAAYMTNASNYHTAHFANSGSGGVLYLQNNGNSAGTGGGDFITAVNANETDIQFRVDSAGNVTADGTFTPGGADYAEMLPAEPGLEPGDLLAIGPDGTLVKAAGAYSTSVAGIYSTSPGFVAGGGDAEGNGTEGKVPVAVLGVVPAKASAENGAIRPGDLLTTSDTPGHVMKATDRDRMLGAIVGKALESLGSGTGTIKVLVTLQ